MPQFSLNGFDNGDLTDSFVQYFKPKNFLIQELGLFTDVGSDSRFAGVDYYVSEDSDILVPTDNQRFGTDTNAINFRQTKTIALEIPMQETSTKIGPQSWQNKRSFGGVGEKTPEECVVEATQKQADARDAYVEYKMSMALVNATQEAANTANEFIDYQSLFGSSFTALDISLSETTFDVPGWIARTQSQVKRRARGLPMERIFVFCAPEVYFAFMQHPSVKEMLKQTVSPFDANNFLTNFTTYGGLSDVQSFGFAGFIFILCDDRIFGLLGENECLISPKFADGEQNPLKRYFTKASRDGLIAQQAPQTSYAYTYLTERNHIELVTEVSALCTNILPSLYSKVTVQL